MLPRSAPRDYAPAIALTIAILVTAPAIGELRNVVFGRLPEAGIIVLTATLGLAALVLLGAAVVRIRRQRARRYAALGAAALLIAWQQVTFASGSAQVDLVEKIHLVEYGGLAFLLYRIGRRRAGGRCDPVLLLAALLAVTVAGTLDEWVQWLAQKRQGEIRDVAINVWSGVVGLIVGLALAPPKRWSWSVGHRGRAALAWASSATVLTVGMFFSAAHLGHRIAHSEVGMFRSWHTEKELRAAAAERRERWSRQPPSGLEVWSLEDLFLTEAGSHALYRNQRRAAGDSYAAWHTNRILEEYYAPYLDLDGFLGTGPRRWHHGPVRKRLRAEAEAASSGALYASPVLSRRVKLWPAKVPFLVAVGLVAFGLAVLAWSTGRGHRDSAA